MKWILVLALFFAGFWLRWERGQQMGVVLPDTIRFIQQAQRIPTDPIGAVRDEVYHPLHSVAILGTHEVLVRLKFAGPSGEDTGMAAVEKDRLAWATAAMIDGTFFGSLMAVLIFLLGRQLGANYWGAIAGAVMWIIGQRTSAYGSDGMSDMMAICFFTASMLFAMRAMRFGRRAAYLHFATAGVMAGLAYLTRPEGLAAPLMVTVTVVIWWAVARRRGRATRGPLARRDMRWFKLIPKCPPPTKQAVLGMGCMWIAVLALALPYAITIGGITQKKHLFSESAAADFGSERVPAAEQISVRGPVMAAVANGDATKNPIEWVWEEIAKTVGYAPMVVLLIAMLWKRELWGRARLRLLVIVWTAIWCAVMFWLLHHAGYLNGRHTLPVVVLAYGLLGIALHAWERPIRHWTAYRGRWPAVFAAGVFVFMAAVTLPMLRLPVWAEFISEREAAKWVRQNIADQVMICDKQQVVGYYSLHPFAHWLGEPTTPQLGEVERIKESLRRKSQAEPMVMLGKLYEEGRGVVDTIGAYRAVATFGQGSRRGDLYVLYALPGEKVMRDGSAATFLAQRAADAKKKAPEAGPLLEAVFSE